MTPGCNVDEGTARHSPAQAQSADGRLGGVVFAKLYPNPAEPFRGAFVADQVAATSEAVRWEVIAPVPLVPKWVADAFGKPHAVGTRDDGGVRVHYAQYAVLPRRLFYATVPFAMAAASRRAFASARHAVDAQFVHAHELYPAGEAARRLAERAGLPYILTVHGSDLYLNLGNPRWRRGAQASAAGAAAIVCVGSRLAADCVRILGVDFKKVLVIPNTYDCERFVYAGDGGGCGCEGGGGCAPATRPLRLLSVGRLSPEKGHEVLLKAFAALADPARSGLAPSGTAPPDATSSETAQPDAPPQNLAASGLSLTIVGDGAERAALARLAEGLGISDRVRFTGVLVGEPLVAEMRAADLFVLPSLAEGFGVVLIEAMATGLPVVATRSGGPEDIVNDANGVLVEPGDSEALARGIREAAERLAVYDRAAIAADVAARYSPQAVGRRLTALYQEAVAGGPLSRRVADPGAVAVAAAGTAVAPPPATTGSVAENNEARSGAGRNPAASSVRTAQHPATATHPATAQHLAKRIVMIKTAHAFADPRIGKEADALTRAGYEVVVLAWDRTGAGAAAEAGDAADTVMPVPASGIAAASAHTSAASTPTAAGAVGGWRVEHLGPRAAHGGGVRSLPAFREFWGLAGARAAALGADAIHCHDLDTAPAALRALKLLRGGSAPRLVLDFWEMYRHSRMLPQRGLLGVVARAAARVLERRSVPRADFVITVAEGQLGYYEGLGAKKIVLVENAPLLSNYSLVSRSESEFVVSFIGRMRYAEALHTLMRAVQPHDELAALLVGGGPSAGEIACEAARLERIQIRGAVPNSEIGRLYHQCDAVFACYDISLENWRTALPVKVMEGMACGLPVIVTKGSWVADYVAREGLGLAVDHTDVADVERALLVLSGDREAAREMGRRGRVIVERELNWDAAAGRLTEAYRELFARTD
ncbi:MAG: glycosyltransferase [Coriobacteriia bacterium]|nr:glycosyltransferase [Coriobacteriia bacterium]